MTELETEIAANRAAVDEFIAAARAVEAARWGAPREGGAWSPAQIAEHLALVYEYNRQVVQGTAEGLPFPLGLRRAAEHGAGLLPWAWALNGAFSVVATPLANLVAVQAGFHWVLIFAALMYVIVLLAFPSVRRSMQWQPSPTL